jgi:hypothetical protein
MSNEHKQSYRRKNPIDERADGSNITDLDLIGIKPGLSVQQ